MVLNALCSSLVVEEHGVGCIAYVPTLTLQSNAMLLLLLLWALRNGVRISPVLVSALEMNADHISGSYSCLDISVNSDLFNGRQDNKATKLAHAHRMPE